MGEKPAGRKGRITKDREDAFGGDGHVHCVDGGDGFMGIYICQFVETCKMVYFK